MPKRSWTEFAAALDDGVTPDQESASSPASTTSATSPPPEIPMLPTPATSAATAENTDEDEDVEVAFTSDSDAPEYEYDSTDEVSVTSTDLDNGRGSPPPGVTGPTSSDDESETSSLSSLSSSSSSSTPKPQTIEYTPPSSPASLSSSPTSSFAPASALLRGSLGRRIRRVATVVNFLVGARARGVERPADPASVLAAAAAWREETRGDGEMDYETPESVAAENAAAMAETLLDLPVRELCVLANQAEVFRRDMRRAGVVFD
ncbi:hypothetical protein F4780DRAFT_775026 [Xylariomycetidae sp. FL0641]|nr:hypothetical protein F4780DRAFT_775026 [Xylariomycetidae sp. FL0641]